MNTYCCSNGMAVNQSTINRYYNVAIHNKHVGNGAVMCECCGHERATDNDHTISQKRCKEIGKTELIWNPENFVSSCRRCHMEWESYKSGEFRKHLNYIKRMEFLKNNDMETFNKRL